MSDSRFFVSADVSGITVTLYDGLCELVSEGFCDSDVDNLIKRLPLRESQRERVLIPQCKQQRVTGFVVERRSVRVLPKIANVIRILYRKCNNLRVGHVLALIHPVHDIQRIVKSFRYTCGHADQHA